jgi:hypothetical protein
VLDLRAEALRRCNNISTTSASETVDASVIIAQVGVETPSANDSPSITRFDASRSIEYGPEFVTLRDEISFAI